MKVSNFFQSVFFVVLLHFSSFANEPEGLTISGPPKICTNDEVNYTFSVAGNAHVNSQTWYVNGSAQATTDIFAYTAPAGAATVRIKCVAQISSGNTTQEVIGVKDVSVVVPTFSVSRGTFDSTGFSQNTGNPPPQTSIGATGTALIHRNITNLDSERFPLTISVSPGDICIQNLRITTSDLNALHLYEIDDAVNLMSLPQMTEHEVGRYATFDNTYPNAMNFYVEGKSCGTSKTVQIDINGNNKLSLNYDIYGIDNPIFSSAISTYVRSLYLYAFPDLVDNEWSVINDSDNPNYNCLAYAIKQEPKFAGSYFWVKHIISTNPPPPCTFVLLGSGTYLTCLDTFGNNNGIFEEQDIVDFYTHPYWGNDKVTGTVNSITNSKIIYYNTAMTALNYHAARKSSRTEGSYPGWHMFESKTGQSYIIIHRAEQLENSVYGSILKMLK